MFSTGSLPSYPHDATVDSLPLLNYSASDHLPRRSSPPSLHTAARFFRRASGRRMMLREPSMRVRENAAEQLEAQQSHWALSKPVVIVDVIWNLSFVAIGVVVLGLSREEKPSVPLRVWVCGYLLQGVFHCMCVVEQYRRRRVAAATVEQENNIANGRRWESGGDLNYNSGSDGENYGLVQDGDRNSIRKRIESVNTMLSFIWWVLGFYWVTTGGQRLTKDSPQIYWLCIMYLGCDIVIVLICVVVACLVGIAVCCCLPCILAILSVVSDQEGASKEEINQLPKYRFQRVDELKNMDGDNVQNSSKGIMTECDKDTPAEHILSMEDAECCICLSPYEDGVELRELPCNHHFHMNCIDKWLHINATCPLCKFNVLTANQHQV